MIAVSVVDVKNNKVGSLELDEKIFGQPVNVVLLHEAVLMQLNNTRQGTHSTKTKGLVRGGGKKPWKQKGTGRARAGSSRSPVWVGGGTIFGPLPRDYAYSMPRKKGRLALYSALSSKLKENALVVVDSLAGRSGKTKEAASVLKTLNVIDSALIICDDKDKTLYRGVRNLPGVAIMDVLQLNVYDLLRYRNLVISKEDIQRVMEAWS
jgi:large subunit ribosomal protein L4